MRKTVLALSVALLALAGAYAAVTIINLTEWHVQATQPPVKKLGNQTLSPVVQAGWGASGGLNVTFYKLFFVPGWQESYSVGLVNASGVSGHLEKAGESGTGQYYVYLGGALQLSNTQSSGPDVPFPATVKWVSTATSRYSVAAWLRYTAGASVQQLVNFTATPMRLLYSAQRSCSVRTFSDDFSGACVPVQYSFSVSVPNNRSYTSGRSTVYLDQYMGNPAPSLYTESAGGYAAFFIDYSQQPFSASTSFAVQYFFRASLQDTDYLQVNFFIDTNGDGAPDVEVVYYGSGGGTSPLQLAPVIYGKSLTTVVRVAPGFVNKANVWYTIAISQVYTTGRVVGLALAAYSSTGVAKVWWDNVDFQKCAPPSYLGGVTNGGPITMVYVDSVNSPSTAPSVATEVDARNSTGNLAQDYGLSAAAYDVQQKLGSVPAAGFSFSVKGLYVRNSTDARNNLAYVSVAVDTNGDGYVDTEYVFYRNDTAQGPGYLAPVFPTTTRIVAEWLGSMLSGYAYTWNGSLPLNATGNVVYVALAVTDATGYASGTADDFWVFWDDLSLTYYACDPLPSGWSSSGSLVYMPLVGGGASYAANFTGTGSYGFYLLGSNLNKLFGVYVSSGSYYAVCGAATVPLYTGSAYWVDLRLLSGVYEAIVRGSDGSILSRYSCAPPGSPSYVGFENVGSFTLNVWGP